MKKSYIPILLGLIVTFSSCNSEIEETQNRNSITEVVNKENIWKHLESFQEIANKNNNNRAVGSPGGIASAEYIVSKLKEYGLKPIIQKFTNSSGKPGQNVIVEIKGTSNKITMLGAHYDSVEFGPGINDNATGVAILLDIISKFQTQKINPNNTFRIAFWDSEENGVTGSKYYVKNLTNSDKQQLANYINVDMVGTKDPEFLILDGDGSSWDVFLKKGLENSKTDKEKEDIKELVTQMKNASPKQVPGAEKLEQIYAEYLTSKNIKFKDDYILSISTDVFPFLGVVPTFGIIMTHESEGKNGETLYAPCYHEACDDIKNVDENSVKIASESITHLLNKLLFK